VALREAAVVEREGAVAAAGHELAAQSAVFERGRDDADRRWGDLERQLSEVGLGGICFSCCPDSYT
jgi:hypothetical protein